MDDVKRLGTRAQAFKIVVIGTTELKFRRVKSVA